MPELFILSKIICQNEKYAVALSMFKASKMRLMATLNVEQMREKRYVEVISQPKNQLYFDVR